MARITNYGELKAAVAQRMHLSLALDLVNVIDQFQQSIEDTLTLQLNSWHNRESLILGDGQRADLQSNEYNLPSDFWGVLEVIKNPRPIPAYADFYVWDENSKVQKSITANHGVNEIRAGAVMPIEGYSIDPESNWIRFNYIPEEGTVFKMFYTIGVQPLINDADTSILITWNPNVYVYGLCGEIASFTQDMEMEAYYRNRFNVEVERINERGIQMDDKGPAQIEGASSWV